ncbi:hypothetical protein EV363DRAFT_1195100, partial [Boletus edulis]
NMLYQITFTYNFVAPTATTAFLFLETCAYITFYTSIPRFIIGIRELYDRDIRGRFHIDTGFGVGSELIADMHMTVPAMVITDGNQGSGVEDGMTNSGDLELGGVYGSGLSEDSPIGARE